MKRIIAKEDANEWSIAAIDEDSLFIKRLCDFSDRCVDTLDITIDYWYFAVITVRKESLFFIRDSKKILFPGNRYALFYPPFSICNIGVDCSRIDVDIFASKKPMERYFPKEPHIFQYGDKSMPISHEEVCHILQNINSSTAIGISSAPSGIGCQIKKALEKNYNEPHSLATLAAQFSLSPSLFSMHFKKAFYTTPSHYRKCLRIASSVVDLLQSQQEKNISTVALDNGYNDLSRFNKQFKSILGISPRKVKN